MAQRFRRRKQPAKGNYAFIDSQNLNLGTQKMGWKIDWRKFRQFLREKYGVTHAYMFIGYMAENEQLYEHMHELGYLIVLKPTLDIKATPDAVRDLQASAMQGAVEQRTEPYKGTAKEQSQAATQQGTASTRQTGGAADDQAGAVQKPQVKGNIDADLVLHAMKELPNYDKAIIVSGDGDFFGLIEYLVEKKKLLHIMTPNWQYSSLLKQFETYIIRLDQLKNELRYHDRHSRKK